jgi:hypothetical protein
MIYTRTSSSRHVLPIMIFSASMIAIMVALLPRYISPVIAGASYLLLAVSVSILVARHLAKSSPSVWGTSWILFIGAWIMLSTILLSKTLLVFSAIVLIASAMCECVVGLLDNWMTSTTITVARKVVLITWLAPALLGATVTIIG